MIIITVIIIAPLRSQIFKKFQKFCGRPWNRLRYAVWGVDAGGHADKRTEVRIAALLVN